MSDILQEKTEYFATTVADYGFGAGGQGLTPPLPSLPSSLPLTSLSLPVI